MFFESCHQASLRIFLTPRAYIVKEGSEFFSRPRAHMEETELERLHLTSPTGCIRRRKKLEILTCFIFYAPLGNIRICEYTPPPPPPP